MIEAGSAYYELPPQVPFEMGTLESPFPVHQPVEQTFLQNIPGLSEESHALLESNNIFIPEVPLAAERFASVTYTEELRNTAQHENGHAIMGGGARLISLKQSGSMLGYCIPLRMDQYTAAAGAVDTTVGKASGFGMDKYQAQQMDFKDKLNGTYTGQSWEDRVKHAKSKIYAIPEKVREIAGDICVYWQQTYGDIPGHYLPMIFMRAAQEAKLEEKNIDLEHLYSQQMRDDQFAEKVKIEQQKVALPPEYTQIGHDIHGNQIEIHVNGDTSTVEIRYQCCGGTGGHTQFCEIGKKLAETKNPFSSTGIIYPPMALAA